ncbi:unnamed protein product [Lactuca saligna]|uniref:phosphopyruvate hydratase n=1 Tax=Lactuca saligna TaxID=75948 RepID=A0AA35YBI7_LACSI|nr:unnamed protein product [Lactuca saligna]
MSSSYPKTSVNGGENGCDWVWNEIKSKALRQPKHTLPPSPPTHLSSPPPSLTYMPPVKETHLILLLLGLLPKGEPDTVTEVIEVVKMAKDVEWRVVISQRSGETKDYSIADLAVDLAGSEGAKRTGSDGMRFKEACVSPVDINVEETLNTLKYANRTRNIQNKLVVNRDPMSSEMLKMRQQLECLQAELCACACGCGSIVKLELKNMVIALLSIFQFGIHIPLSLLFVYKLNLGVGGAMIALSMSSWFLVIVEFVYIFGGWCPYSWKGFTSAAFKDLLPVVKLSISSDVMVW